MMNPRVEAYIGLGSNLASPVLQLEKACTAIAQRPEVWVIGISDFYQSPPMGPKDQPDYLNAVMRIQTTLSATDLLRALQHIEQQQGRVRTQRWGARTLDLDVLLYGGEQINEPNLTVPHPGIAERAFVLYPLADVAPINLDIPGYGKLSDCLVQCSHDGLMRLNG